MSNLKAWILKWREKWLLWLGTPCVAVGTATRQCCRSRKSYVDNNVTRLWPARSLPNSSTHREAMSSSGRGIGSTLTGGIQDIAAILPLLGTEQCSIQVSSAALTRGYLYAASTPMSIFGSLGVVSAGFKTLVTCFTFGGIEGAKILRNMGFEPQGENLSLIMVEAGKAGKGKNTGCYIIETRMDELIKQKPDNWGISHLHCLEYQDDGHDRAPVCFQHCSIYLFSSRPPSFNCSYNDE